MRRAALLLALTLLGCKPRETVLVLFATAEVKGTIAPCGCTTDPLGGIDRVAGLVRAAREPRALLTAGPYARDPAAAGRSEGKAEAEGKAALLERAFATLGGMRPGVHEMGGARVAILEAKEGVPLERPPNVAVAIALFDLPKVEARKRLKEARGIDFGIVGRKVELGDVAPEPVGRAWLLTPGSELQKIVRVEIHLRPGAQGPLAYAGGPGDLEQIDRRVRSLEEQLIVWERQGADADPAFVAERKEELSSLRREREQRMQRGVVRPPDQGSWFTSELVAVRHTAPQDGAVLAEMKALAKKVGEENRKVDCQKERPAKVEPTYVGAARCGEAGCHPEALAQWKTTVHSRAWKTLIDDGRAFSTECIGCHVTGFGEEERGGATLCKPEPLIDVQCEVCHGPASAHVKAEGLEDPPAITRKPADDLCATKCHTKEHSDTFELAAYLRDVLGPGHGGRARAKLGPGPTGRELRQAGLKRAGRAH